MLSTLDVYIDFVLIGLYIYGIKRWSDYNNKRKDAENELNFPHIPSHSDDFFREYKRENRKTNFILMPFFVLTMYAALRITGVLENPFF